jgi:hypothetical protein
VFRKFVEKRSVRSFEIEPMTPRNLLGGITAFPVNVYVFSAKGAVQDEAWAAPQVSRAQKNAGAEGAIHSQN